MAYVVKKTNAATAAAQGGQSINGYRVRFFQDGKWHQSQRFNRLSQALGFQRGLRFGRNSSIEPVTKK